MSMVFKGVVTLLLLVATVGATHAATLKNGSVLKVQGAVGLYYYINGYAAHIPSPAVYSCLGLERKRVVMVSRQQLDAMPKTAFLIRGSTVHVYRIDGESKRLVPNLQVFRKLGFNESEIIPVDDGVLECIADGPPLH